MRIFKAESRFQIPVMRVGEQLRSRYYRSIKYAHILDARMEGTASHRPLYLIVPEYCYSHTCVYRSQVEAP